MLERFERPLRIACMILGALVLFQVARLAFRHNPLDQLKIPPLPTLSTNVATQSSTNATNSTLAKGLKTTNSATHADGEKKSTNDVAANGSAAKSTNAAQASTTGATNGASRNSNESKNTNSVAADQKATNAASAKTSENKGSNSVISTNAGTKETNVAGLNNGKKKMNGKMSVPPGGFPPGGMAGMSFSPGHGGMKKVDLPPAIQARVDKITQSEILAQIMRPLPMALLGIAGNSAFLRAPSGQSGVVKEGDELGGLKLLKIGTNRVLIEQDGEKKELMVFSGFGGESLLPKEKEQKETPK